MLDFMFVLIPIIFVVVAVISIIAFALYGAKDKKTFTAISEAVKKEIEKATSEEKVEDKFCAYCGSKIEENCKDCPSCGAKIK